MLKCDQYEQNSCSAKLSKRIVHDLKLGEMLKGNYKRKQHHLHLVVLNQFCSGIQIWHWTSSDAKIVDCAKVN